MSEFSVDLSRMISRAQMLPNTVIRGAVSMLCNAVIDRTPVDTGRCVGNWNMSIDTWTKHKTGILAPSRESPKNRMSRELGKFDYRNNHLIFFMNTLEYAIPLERGHSKQAPSGMVRLSLNEFQQKIREAVSSIS